MNNIENLEDILEGLKAIKAGQLIDMQIKAEIRSAVQRLPQVRDDLLKKLAIMEYEGSEFVRGVTMKIWQKIIETKDKASHENYSEFCRRWEKNRELLNNSENGQALINNLSTILKEGETAKIEERQYLTVIGDGFKYTARITWPEVK